MTTPSPSIGSAAPQTLRRGDQKTGPELAATVHPTMTYRPPSMLEDDHVRAIEPDEPSRLPVNPIVVGGRTVTILLSFSAMIVLSTRYLGGGPRLGLFVTLILTFVWSIIILVHHVFLRRLRKPGLPQPHMPEISIICCDWKLYICGEPEDEYSKPKRRFGVSFADLIDAIFALLLLVFVLTSYFTPAAVRVLTSIVIGSLTLTSILRRLKITVEMWPEDEDLYEYRIQLPPDTRAGKSVRMPDPHAS